MQSLGILLVFVLLLVEVTTAVPNELEECKEAEDGGGIMKVTEESIAEILSNKDHVFVVFVDKDDCGLPCNLLTEIKILNQGCRNVLFTYIDSRDRIQDNGFLSIQTKDLRTYPFIRLFSMGIPALYQGNMTIEGLLDFCNRKTGSGYKILDEVKEYESIYNNFTQGLYSNPTKGLVIVIADYDNIKDEELSTTLVYYGRIARELVNVQFLLTKPDSPLAEYLIKTFYAPRSHPALLVFQKDRPKLPDVLVDRLYLSSYIKQRRFIKETLESKNLLVDVYEELFERVHKNHPIFIILLETQDCEECSTIRSLLSIVSREFEQITIENSILFGKMDVSESFDFLKTHNILKVPKLIALVKRKIKRPYHGKYKQRDIMVWIKSIIDEAKKNQEEDEEEEEEEEEYYDDDDTSVWTIKQKA